MNCEVQNRQAEIDALYAEYFSDDEPGASASSVETDKSELTQGDKNLCSKISGSKQGEKFQKLFAGNINGYPSHSEADQALSNILAFWTKKDSKAMDRIFRQSGLYREKWDVKHGEQTYGVMTIGKAIAGTKETYRKPGSKPADDLAGVGQDDLLDRLVYVQDGNLVADLTREPQNAILKINEFYNTFKNKPRVQVGDTKPMLATTAWLQSPKRKTVRGRRFYPGKDIIFHAEGEDWFNSFYVPKWEKPSNYNRLNVFLNHLERLIPDSEEREVFFNWMAYTVHHPEIRPSFTPLLISHHHGTGRGWLVKLIQALLGNWNCSHTKMKTLAGQGGDGQYHNYLYQTLFCSIPEVKVDKNKYDIDDEIRDKLTDSPLNLNLKYGDNGTYAIFTNFLLSSNHRDALVITAEDRRIFVVENYDPPPTEDYFTTILYPALQDQGFIAQVFWWLKNNVSSSFNPYMTAPMTPAKSAMIESAKSDLEGYFDDMVDDTEVCDIISYKMFEDYAKDNGYEWHEDSRMAAVAILKHKALKCNGGKKIKVAGKSILLYAIRNPSKWGRVSRNEIRAEYQNLWTK